MMQGSLTANDPALTELIRSEVEEERATATHKLCRSMERMELTEEERAAAQRVITFIARDTADLVRRALAVTLRASTLMPRETALKLAADVDSIAIPLISQSPVFSDDDLISIVRTGRAHAQVAVASRAGLSRDVAEVVASDGVVDAVRKLAANDNADVSERAMSIAIDRFAHDDEVVSTLSHRQILPPAIVDRLLVVASEQVRQHLVQRHKVSVEAAVRLSDFARERATLDLLDEAIRSQNVPEFVRALHARRALTGSLLLRAVARGQMTLFEHGLSLLAQLPHHRAWLMIHDAGPLGLRAIYDRAGLPPRLFAAFRAAVDTWRSIQAEGTDLDGDSFRQRMLERFMTQMHTMGREDMDYLLERLDMIPTPDNAALRTRVA
ncbi:DUF2336 domain-containing protein [uncultured Brevundimonas sp.]|uniref:DUF2336 domain-containing protein n=1 Tax=uncultured Brevundimonas sp. TaxID=213418 RepID=UPI00260CE420|nr:DUF2336 domain-containing protein [uncultured Brevundimonas sp.]